MFHIWRAQKGSGVQFDPLGGVTLGSGLKAVDLLVDIKQWLMLNYNLNADMDFYTHIDTMKHDYRFFYGGSWTLEVFVWCRGGQPTKQVQLEMTRWRNCAWPYFNLLRYVTEGTSHGFLNVDFFNVLWQSQTNMQTEEVAKLN